MEIFISNKYSRKLEACTDDLYESTLNSTLVKFCFGASINTIIITKSDKNPEVARGQSIESILKSGKLTRKCIINYQKRDDKGIQVVLDEKN